MLRFLASLAATVSLLLAVLYGYSAAPGLYARHLATDPEAAAALQDLPQDRIGAEIVSCLNTRNQTPSMWHDDDFDTLKAYENFSDAPNSDFYFISGRLGWHVTWAVHFSMNSDTITAYETLDPQNQAATRFARIPVPAQIIGALKHCGVAYADGPLVRITSAGAQH